jgi:nucleotide-binding universal stress UspA family protein
MQLKLILCPVDFSEFSARAYRYAASVASHYGAKLVALHVLELFRYPSMGFAVSAGLYDESRRALREGAAEQLRKFVAENAHEKVHSTLELDEGMAADVILDYVETRHVDGIVMGTHGRRGYDRLMLGSVTDRVMRRTACPVLAVCQTPPEIAIRNAPAQAHHLTRIIFCTDFSENSERALRWAISATQEYDAELTLLHVLDHAPSTAKKDEVIAGVTAELEKLIPADERKSLKVKMSVRIGKPYRQIIQAATEIQANMVAMGVHGRGALDVAVFGSTTYRVMQLGCCPVLAVRV